MTTQDTQGIQDFEIWFENDAGDRALITFSDTFEGATARVDRWLAAMHAMGDASWGCTNLRASHDIIGASVRETWPYPH